MGRVARDGTVSNTDRAAEGGVFHAAAAATLGSVTRDGAVHYNDGGRSEEVHAIFCIIIPINCLGIHHRDAELSKPPTEALLARVKREIYEKEPKEAEQEQ